MSRLHSLLPLVALVTALGASAATYDAAVDWNPPNNPNGTWSYRSGSTPLPYQPSVVPLGGAGGYAPSPAWEYFLPLFWSAGGGADIYVHSYDPGNGKSATGEAALVWTSPINGKIDISGYLYYAQDQLQRSNDINLSLGGNSLLVATVAYDQHQDFANRLPLSFSQLEVAAGEQLVLTFIRSPGQPYGTVTAFNVDIVATAVPEPATGLLMVGGLGLLWGLGRRRSAI